MKKTQVSTNIGVLTILSGFLAVFNDVQLTEFMSVFQGLSFGQVATMCAPVITGVWAIFHNEDKKADV